MIAETSAVSQAIIHDIVYMVIRHSKYCRSLRLIAHVRAPSRPGSFCRSHTFTDQILSVCALLHLFDCLVEHPGHTCTHNASNIRWHYLQVDDRPEYSVSKIAGCLFMGVWVTVNAECIRACKPTKSDAIRNCLGIRCWGVMSVCVDSHFLAATHGIYTPQAPVSKTMPYDLRRAGGRRTVWMSMDCITQRVPNSIRSMNLMNLWFSKYWCLPDYMRNCYLPNRFV